MLRFLPFMTFVPLGSGGSTPLRVFDRWRCRFLAGVQDPQLRRSGFVMMGIAAGLTPLMAGAAHAALPKAVNDGADTLLMLMGSALVLLMTPGLAFFYGGFTRSKNVLNTMMMSFFLMGLIGVLWVVIGYSLAFDGGFKAPSSAAWDPCGSMASAENWAMRRLPMVSTSVPPHSPCSRACSPSSRRP